MGQLGIGSNKGTLAQVITPKKVVLDEKIKEVACGLDYTLFVTAAGHLFSAGSSESGQLGVNDNGEYIDGRKVCGLLDRILSCESARYFRLNQILDLLGL